MENLQKFIDYFKNYTNNFSTIGIVFLIVDVLLVIGLIIFFQKILKVKFKIKKVILFSTLILPRKKTLSGPSVVNTSLNYKSLL